MRLQRLDNGLELFQRSLEGEIRRVGQGGFSAFDFRHQANLVEETPRVQPEEKIACRVADRQGRSLSATRNTLMGSLRIQVQTYSPRALVVGEPWVGMPLGLAVFGA